MVTIDSNYVYRVLTAEQVRQLKMAEGNGVGNGVLPQLLDSALAGDNDTNTISQITGLTAALAAKQDIAKLVFIDSAVSVGGSATEVLTFTGMAVSDTILALTDKAAGTNSESVAAFGSPVLNGLSVTFTGDPGTGKIVRALVRKA